MPGILKNNKKLNTTLILFFLGFLVVLLPARTSLGVTDGENRYCERLSEDGHYYYCYIKNLKVTQAKGGGWYWYYTKDLYPVAFIKGAGPTVTLNCFKGYTNEGKLVNYCPQASAGIQMCLQVALMSQMSGKAMTISSMLYASPDYGTSMRDLENWKDESKDLSLYLGKNTLNNVYCYLEPGDVTSAP